MGSTTLFNAVFIRPEQVVRFLLCIRSYFIIIRGAFIIICGAFIIIRGDFTFVRGAFIIICGAFTFIRSALNIVRGGSSVIILSEPVPLVSVVECYTILLYVMSSRISKHSSNIHRAITCHFLLGNLQVERSYKTVKYIRLFWRFKSKVNPGGLKYGTNTAIFKFGDFAWPI